MTTNDITPPTVHLNGTSSDGLVEPLIDAYEKLGDALDSLMQTSPNARDYYVQPEGAIERATTEHVARMRQVSAVRDDIETLISAIRDQA
jgi:hypothetical protein